MNSGFRKVVSEDCGMESDSRSFFILVLVNTNYLNEREKMDNKRFTKMKHDSPFLKRALWESYNKKCIYCGMELTSKEVEIEHLWPSNAGKDFAGQDMIEFREELKRRGFETETLENYVISCKDCNGSAKKGNKSLGVSNLRFYYFITFSKRDKVIQKIRKYEREMGDGLEGDVNCGKNDNRFWGDTQLLVPKRVSNTIDSSFYVWGKGHACIRAFIPLDYKKEMSCCISTAELSKSSIFYTLSHEDMERYMFAGIGTAIEERPWCISYNSEEGRKDYYIAFPNIKVEATYEEVKELSEIIDDLFEEYMLQDSRVRDILGINVFESSLKNEVLILSIPKGLWYEIVNFARQHLCNQENTEWNIFNTNCNDKIIQLCRNENDEMKPNDLYFMAGVLVQFAAKESDENMMSIYWLPGFGARERCKTDNFDNEFKWKADYAHDWFVYKLIPFILFSHLSFHKKLKYKEYTDEKFIGDYVKEENSIISYKEKAET